MVIHTCDRCFKDFNRLSSYKKHYDNVDCLKRINRKKFKCENCDKDFLKKSYIPIHLLKCKKNNINNSGICVEINGNENSTTNNINPIYNTTNTNNITNNITNNTNIILNFKICDFGKENYDLIDENKLFDDKDYIFLNLFEEIHLNPLKPENHNILLTDQSRNNCKIIKNSEWVSKTIDEIVKKTVHKSFHYLNALKETLKPELKKKIEYEINKFIMDALQKPLENERTRLNSKIIDLLYDNKNVIKETYKNHEKSKEKRNNIRNNNKKNRKVIISDSSSSSSLSSDDDTEIIN